jgi:hypothetical protein
MSYLEKTAKKLLPILQEVKKKMLPEKKVTATRNSSIYSMDEIACIEEFESIPKNIKLQ